MSKTTHGGKREGAGRPPRPERKARSIWCGQITDDDRKLILTLTPEERHAVLLKAAKAKQNPHHAT